MWILLIIKVEYDKQKTTKEGKKKTVTFVRSLTRNCFRNYNKKDETVQKFVVNLRTTDKARVIYAGYMTT